MSFEREVKGSLFQVASTPVCVENTLGWDKLPRLSVLYLWLVLSFIKLDGFVCKIEQSSGRSLFFQARKQDLR